MSAVPAPASRRPLPLAWSAPLSDPSGYADEARAFLRAFEAAGLDVAAQAVAWTAHEAGLDPRQRATVERALARRPPSPHVLVQHRIPLPGVPLNADGPTVYRTMFETDRIPAHWPALLLGADEIWVPSAWNVETFERGGIPASRIRVLPETLDFELFDPAGVEPLDLPGRRSFAFLTNFDFTDRKGWDILLDAWAEAFDPDDDVCLVLKLMSLHGEPLDAIRARIDAHLAGRRTAPVLLEPRLLPLEELPRLYAAADAFVLPSRGEGWGRPYMEAMAMGLPTIGSRWSGSTAFMHDGTAFLLDGEVVPVGRWSQLHSDLYAGHRWFEPDRDALVAALRLVRRGGPDVRARAGAARADLLHRFGPQPVADLAAALTEAALDRWSVRSSRPVACVWRGPWGSSSSLAIVNDGVAGALEADGLVVRRVAADGGPVPVDAPTVASSWPVRLEPASNGPLVLYQPWEFGAIPEAWLEQIRHGVDEVWTPSEVSRAAYLASGVSPELVHVVPNGVDLDRFAPDGPTLPLPTRKGTVFLFVGGTIYRKGFDVLLHAFAEAFTAADDVCLVVKSTCGESFYRGQTADEGIARFRALPDAPELLVVDEELADVAALYRAADCLVQPYRGEGFCLPVLEALACGVPAIVTAGGATDAFVSDACAWRVDAAPAPLPPSELVLAGEGFLLEPDRASLVAALREAADPKRRRAKAAAARAHAEPWSWTAAAAVARERLRALEGRTPIRRLRPAAVPGARRCLFAASPDWDDRGTWEPVVRAWADAFDAAADATLVLAAPDEAAAVGAIVGALERAAIDPASLADIAVAVPEQTGRLALELAAHAVIDAGGARPRRARRVVSPDPAALRAVLEAA